MDLALSHQVDPELVAAHIGDPAVRLVEIDVSPAGYRAGHIPGAVFWDAYADLRHPDYSTISTEALGSLIRASGIDATTTVVMYGYAAHLGYWLLRSYGHERVVLMDGPRDRWVDAGRSMTTIVPEPTATRYAIAPEHRFIATTGEVAETGDDGSTVLLDVRSEAEFRGDRFWPSGAPEAKGRPGHIPASIHLPIDLLRTSGSMFRPTEEMRRVMGDHGITPESDVITYCTIGNRAAQAWFALTILLGFEKARVYYDSYVTWGMDPTAPIEA